MKQTSKLSMMSLEKNVANLITSYAANEYDKLVHTEMERRNNFAIIVEDYYMGRALGRKHYISGKTRDINGEIINYDPNSTEQNKQIEECYYSDKYDITSSTGKKLGSISIYISDFAMKSELKKIIIDTLFNTIAISLLLIVTLVIMIRFFVLKPLSDIIDVINKNDDGIPFDRVPVNGPKEISALSNTINRMIDTIKISKKAFEKQSEAIQYQAHHDALTGLPNRYLFNDRLTHGLEKAKRNHTQIAILFIDLDNFKEINDSLGHEIGDEILKVVTQKLYDTIRKEDTLARLGGDEFTIMLEDLKQGQEASVLASKITSSLNTPIVIQSHQLYISSSIGISLYPDNGLSSQDLLKYADAAMYKAKKEGKNNFQYYSIEMTEQALEKVLMETKIREALKNKEFVVYYQPQFNAGSNKLIGMEALVRWQSPTMGFMPPAKFISIAEISGLIVELDRFVMKEAMTQLSHWYKQGLKPGVLAMNLTIKQLHQQDFVSIFEQLIKQTECKPPWLELEVTESQIMINPEKNINTLIKIIDDGVKLSLDDFGTGYSSLSYLKKLPITKLKIDQSFIRNLSNGDEDASIVKAVIALANSLDLEIIAEGVETKEQKSFLMKNGCNNIQGYLYSKPIPADEMEQYLKKN